jgi:cobyrinic acid a,c-diamide synthase
MAALRRRGFRVQPFKVGPDFIDPTLHTRAAGRISRNLDGWMLGAEANLQTFTRSSIDANFSVVEGVMGLFDGRDALTDAGSTAEMSKLLTLPVLLVVDASAMARSAAALIHGYESFDQDLDLAGVIFNRVAGAGHFAYLREAVEANCRARVLGWLGTNESIALPERHLGLFMPNEVLNEARLNALVSWIEMGVDVDELIRFTRERLERQAVVDSPPVEIESMALQEGPQFDRRPRIGIARDNAFCFYYQDNLDLLVNAGAEIVEFSPIEQKRLPESLDGLYLGGGYPELHAAALAANQTMRDDVANFAHSGRPVYGECGGLMYLTEAIVDQESNSFPMVGVFPTRARMRPRLAALGYAEVEGMNKTGWLRPGEHARGHEFRYSLIDDMPEHVQRQYQMSTMAGTRQDGFSVGNVLASYMHLHFKSCPQFAARFVAACAGSQTSFETVREAKNVLRFLRSLL